MCVVAAAAAAALFLSTLWYRFCPRNQEWNFGKHAEFAFIVIYLTYSCLKFDGVTWQTDSIINYDTVTDSVPSSALYCSVQSTFQLQRYKIQQRERVSET